MNSMAPPETGVALSIKQPWAALLVAGIKTIEIRTWPTRRRGPVLIHTGKIADDRPEGWDLITTPELLALAQHRGGLIGSGELIDCVKYSAPEAFAAEINAHRNALEWFRPAGLYGFVFQNLHPIAYHPYQGQTLFFTVDLSSAGLLDAHDRIVLRKDSPQ